MRAAARALLTVGAVVATLSPAFAQDAPVIEVLQVSLWPEHDKSEMLVMIEGVLDASVELPATVVVPIPMTIAEPHAVAKGGGAGGMPLLADYRVAEDETSKKVFLKTDDPMFRVEYYAPLVRDAEARGYRYAWADSPSPITQLRFDVRIPGDALSVAVDPAATATSTLGTGQVSHTGILDAIPARGGFQIDVGYTRGTDALVVSAPPPHPPGGPAEALMTPPPLPTAAVPPATAGEEDGSLTWLFAVGIGVLALIGAFLITRTPEEEGEGGDKSGGGAGD